MAARTESKVGFAGLGAMGYGMATHLLRSGHSVTGFDVYQPSLDKFQAAGGATSCSPTEAARGCAVFIIMVTNAQQAESVLFDGKTGAAQGKLSCQHQGLEWD